MRHPGSRHCNIGNRLEPLTGFIFPARAVYSGTLQGVQP